jgi:hypothetical protein
MNLMMTRHSVSFAESFAATAALYVANLFGMTTRQVVNSIREIRRTINEHGTLEQSQEAF